MPTWLSLIMLFGVLTLGIEVGHWLVTSYSAWRANRMALDYAKRFYAPSGTYTQAEGKDLAASAERLGRRSGDKKA
ncbi:MAG: hypothetical protein EOO40_00570 [Deltaproteobacteria bacterium]|nr:MAG: hypothetical protein EOO40_00570 [Deltaproteobacteria bacterium]